MSIETLIESLRAGWHGFLPDPTLRKLAIAALFLGFYYVVVAALERISSSRTQNYRSTGFHHDIVYYLYFKGGIARLVVPATVATALEEPLSFASLRLLEGLSFPVQVVAWLLISDCIGYWVHRAKHHFRFLWAFHTTHHSQTHVNFATYARVHPVEDLLGLYVGLFVSLLLGVSPVAFFLAWLLLDVLGELSHTQIPWRFGPLYWLIVTPRFHLYHHSVDPAHHDRNFGIVFSVWDHLFGTAVDERASSRPVAFGLDEVKPTTLWSTFVAPFELLARYYGPRPIAVAEELAEAVEPRPR